MSKPPNITAAQKRALLQAKRTRLFRTAHGPWRGRGTSDFRHDTIRSLIGSGLLEERNGPSLHVILTPAGDDMARQLQKARVHG